MIKEKYLTQYLVYHWDGREGKVLSSGLFYLVGSLQRSDASLSSWRTQQLIPGITPPLQFQLYVYYKVVSVMVLTAFLLPRMMRTTSSLAK